MINKIYKDKLALLGAHSGFIPVVEDQNDPPLDNEKPIKDEVPILPLRNVVMFPGVIMPIAVGREQSIRLVKHAFPDAPYIGIFSQKDPNKEEVQAGDIYEVGTYAKVLKVLEMPDKSITILVQGQRRILLDELIDQEEYLRGRISEHVEIPPVEQSDKEEYEAILASVRENALKLLKSIDNIADELIFAIKNIESSPFMVNFVSSNIGLPLIEKQHLLEINSLKERSFALLELLAKEVKAVDMRRDIEEKVKVEISQQQKEYMLQQQIKALQDELGGGPQEKEIKDIKKRAKKKKWNKDIAKSFKKELERLERLNPNAADYSIQLNYIQTMLDLPWGEYDDENFELGRAEEMLDEDHYGLEKVKERIVEHLAVLKVKGDMKSPIICLYGPPGVGKTSLGKSVARSLNRKYVRMALGGLSDESEIRGHRRTYIGAMPGRILKNIKKAGVSNPVFILDEIDKVNSSFKGDPQSALLEVLDPEQNNSFHDNFIDLDYDLSKVMFIATANDLVSISQPLRDRMEMVEISGYLMEEKTEIALRHLIPKGLERHGLSEDQIRISGEMLKLIITQYTREAGVRGLDKVISRILRKVTKHIALGEPYSVELKAEELKNYLGAPRFESSAYEGNDHFGVVTGLAWTSLGGDILYIESSKNKSSKGKLTMTGSLGDVMKESATLALEYLKAHCEELDIGVNVFQEYGFHIHVPEGATPKDGPSAGITMITSLVSTIKERKVKKDVAMTGEITLRGKVLPVGGIKEKMIAAKRAGIKEIVLSEENRKDVQEIDKRYIEGLSFYYVSSVKELLDRVII